MIFVKSAYKFSFQILLSLFNFHYYEREQESLKNIPSGHYGLVDYGDKYQKKFIGRKGNRAFHLRKNQDM